ncbi:MAG: ABC transporter ATP-binding protein/permease [Eubacteriaceae bacterium]|nr:ABC transporter ATP-binding protein/permease [Eubacteriaceae bacterium]
MSSEKNNKDKFADIPEQKYKQDEAAQRQARRDARGGGGGGGRMGGGGMGGGGGGGGFGGHGMPADKVDDVKKTLKLTLAYAYPFKWMILAVIAFSSMASIISVWTPVITSHIIDNLHQAAIGALNASSLLRWTLTLASVSLLNAVFGLSQQWISANFTQKIVYSLRRDLEGKLSRLPLKYYDSRTHGEILSRVVYDVDTIGNMLQMSITQVITSTITVVGVLIMMLRLNAMLTLITMSVTPLYALVVYVIAPRSQRYFVGQSRSLGDLNGHIEEMYAGHKNVKLFNYEQHSIDEFEEINERYYSYSRNAQFISGLINPLIQFLGNLGYVLVCVVGGMQMASGRISLGSIAAFVQYVRQFNMPIAQASHMADHIQSLLAAAERVFAVLEEEEEPQEASEPAVISSPEGAIRFEHVSFGYSPEKVLMNDMNIDVKPGQTVAIVGPTGAGKTTLVNLLMRFYDVNSGKITVDGIDIRDMARGGLRTMFGMVLQDTWLFSGTIRENIAYANPNASEEQIVAASKAARADHFIRTLQDGYGTVINEDATNISQGQKQLIAIARAFLSDPIFLILDEATSSVDTRTEILIQSATDELMMGRTSFVIAHRLSTIRNADIILVMNNGAIEEKGTHEELLDAKGLYHEIYNSQYSDHDGQAKGKDERIGA